MIKLFMDFTIFIIKLVMNIISIFKINNKYSRKFKINSFIYIESNI